MAGLKGDRTENEKAPPERARGIIRESQTVAEYFALDKET